MGLAFHLFGLDFDPCLVIVEGWIDRLLWSGGYTFLLMSPIGLILGGRVTHLGAEDICPYLVDSIY